MLSGSQPKKQIQIVTAEDFLCFDGGGGGEGMLKQVLLIIFNVIVYCSLSQSNCK